jgi:hypothetical protein
MTFDTGPGRTAVFVAPAPIDQGEQLSAHNKRDRDLDALCESWARWCRTRRLYGPAPLAGTVLGRLSGATRPVVVVDAICSADLAAFHTAYISQPRDSIDRQVFDAYYVYRVKPIKRAADALGISRQHFYARLTAFRVRVSSAASAIAADNQDAHCATLARRAERQELEQA